MTKKKFSVMNGQGTKQVIEANTMKQAEKKFVEIHGKSDIVVAHEVQDEEN